jgi:hypothetical protein
MSERVSSEEVGQRLGGTAGIALRCQLIRDALPSDGGGWTLLELLDALEEALESEGLHRPPDAPLVDDLRTMLAAGLIEQSPDQPDAYRRIAGPGESA